MNPGIAAMLVAGTWFAVFVVLYLGFGGRMPFYRHPIRMVVAGMLSFIVAMALAFVLFRAAGLNLNVGSRSFRACARERESTPIDRPRHK
jgi:hypothetical protein